MKTYYTYHENLSSELFAGGSTVHAVYLAADIEPVLKDIKEIASILVSGEQYGTKYWKEYMTDEDWWAKTKSPIYSCWLAQRLLERLK